MSRAEKTSSGPEYGYIVSGQADSVLVLTILYCNVLYCKCHLPFVSFSNDLLCCAAAQKLTLTKVWFLWLQSQGMHCSQLFLGWLS